MVTTTPMDIITPLNKNIIMNTSTIIRISIPATKFLVAYLTTGSAALLHPQSGAAAGYYPTSSHFPYIPVKLTLDRKSTRLNSSHVKISYAVFCLKKKIHHTH